MEKLKNNDAFYFHFDKTKVAYRQGGSKMKVAESGKTRAENGLKWHECREAEENFIKNCIFA